MSKPKSSIILGVTRHEVVISMLREVLARLFGKGMNEIGAETSFFDLGADSLFLLQASSAIQEKFKVKIPFRLMLEDLSTIETLALYIDQRLAEDTSLDWPSPELILEEGAPLLPQEEVEKLMAQQDSLNEPVISIPVLLTAENGSQGQGEVSLTTVENIIAQQLKILSQQLELLSVNNGSEESLVSPEAGIPEQSYRTVQPPASSNMSAQMPTRVAPALSPPAISVLGAEGTDHKTEPDTFVAYHPIKKAAGTALSEGQRNHLDGLIARVVARTGESKRQTQAYRPYLADSRASAGFRLLWKEMFYPLIVDRAQGSKIWDVDGNEYIDLTMGFGSLLFGHSPSFIVDAVEEQLRQGIQLGAHSHLGGKAAKLICELTGVERVLFCNSGTEAVMMALRLARTVTGRTRIALFEGSYHGTFDGVMVRGDLGADGQLRALPLAPGVPLHMVDNVLLLKYNSSESLEILKAHAHELAAVLIEPPRSRRPDVQPKSFLQELRSLTQKAGVALIFDEVVTGFRFHPGGAQAMFDVQADLVTYGKAIGGGLPVAAVAGKALYMDAVDGGRWDYGDSSLPEAEITFATGTYFKHPLMMAAVWAALVHIKEQGSKLHEKLDQKTKCVADTLNAYFDSNQIPVKVARLGSLFRFLHSSDLKYMDLLYYHLLEKGIYICETRNCFLSTAHTDEDVQCIIRAVKESINEMREGGFLPELSSDSTKGGRPHNAQFRGSSNELNRPPEIKPNGNPIYRVPLTEAQKQIWIMAQMGDEEARAYNQSTSLYLRGELNVEALRDTVNEIANRHEALRATFSSEGDYQEIAASLKIDIPLKDFSRLEEHDRSLQVEGWLTIEAQRPFDLAHGPLLSVAILKLEETLHILVITMHHIICDGWSFGIILGEIKALYSAKCRKVTCNLPEPRRFGEYAQSQLIKQQGPEMAAAEAYWLNQFTDLPPFLALPTDHARPEVQTYNGAQQQKVMNSSACADLKRLCAKHGSTLFMTLLAGFKVLLYHLTDQEDIVVGTPAAGQISPDGGYLVAYCVNLLPMRSRISGGQSFTQYLRSLVEVLSDVYDHQDYPFGKLVRKLNLSGDPARPPLVSTVFNLDRSGAKQKMFGLEIDLVPNHNSFSKFDITLDVTESDGELAFAIEYNTNLFDSQTIQLWMEHYETILTIVALRPDILIDEIRDAIREGEQQRQAERGQELKKAQLHKYQTTRRKAVHSQ